jgi:hypothetical protein
MRLRDKDFKWTHFPQYTRLKIFKKKIHESFQNIFSDLGKKKVLHFEKYEKKGQGLNSSCSAITRWQDTKSTYKNR